MKTITADDVLTEVARVTGVPVDAILGMRKTRRVSWARFIACAALHKAFPWWSRLDIAEAVGRADHASGLHGLRRAEALEKTEPEFARMLREVLEVYRSSTGPAIIDNSISKLEIPSGDVAANTKATRDPLPS